MVKEINYLTELKVLIIASEPSGDKLGANLVDGLLNEVQGKMHLVFHGVGGPLMKKKGVISFYEFDDLAVMGFTEVVPRLPKIFKIIKQIAKYALAWKPDLIITIDSPDFTLKVSRLIKNAWPDAKTIHYVAPSVWAWRSYRAKKMAKFIDHVLAILPFEPPYMEKEGMSCDFVGHPIVAEQLPSNQEIRLFRNSLGIDRDAPILSILPGSRKSEIIKMMPIYIKALKLVKKKFPNLILVLASPSSVSKLSANYLHQTELSIIQICENDDPLEFEKRKQILFSTSLAAIATSGTVTLELARMGAPFLVVYRASFLTEILLKTFVKLKSANLINIITDRNDVPELLFSECSDLNIYLTLTSLLTDKRLVKNQRLSVDKAMVDLGAFGLDPKIRAARSILKFLSSVEQLK